MRWLVFAIAAAVVVSMQTSPLWDLLTLHRLASMYPSLACVLVVFVALFAPRTAALWAAWVLGLLLDLAETRPTGIFVGPCTLGFVFAAYLVVQVRTMVFRRHVLTLALLAALCVVASGLVEIMLLTVRSWDWLWFDDPELAGFRPLGEFARRLGNGVFTGLFAVPVGWLLLQTLPWWRFEYAADRRRSWR